MEDMVKAYVIDFESSWQIHFPLVKLAYNNSYHSSIGMAPFEALYEKRCQSPLCWEKVGDGKLLGLEMIRESNKKMVIIKKKMKMPQNRH